MSFIYNQALADLTNGTHDWDNASQTYRIVLLNDSYSPNINDIYVSSINTYELSGTNYTPGFGNTGRKNVTSRSISVNTSTNICYYLGSNITFSAINAGQIKYVALVRELTDDNNSKLIFLYSGGGLPITTNGGDVNINWGSNIIFSLRQSG